MDCIAFFVHASPYSSSALHLYHHFSLCPRNAFFPIIDIAQDIHPSPIPNQHNAPTKQPINAIELTPRKRISFLCMTLRIPQSQIAKQCNIHVFTTSNDDDDLPLLCHPSIGVTSYSYYATPRSNTLHWTSLSLYLKKLLASYPSQHHHRLYFCLFPLPLFSLLIFCCVFPFLFFLPRLFYFYFSGHVHFSCCLLSYSLFSIYFYIEAKQSNHLPPLPRPSHYFIYALHLNVFLFPSFSPSSTMNTSPNPRTPCPVIIHFFPPPYFPILFMIIYTRLIIIPSHPSNECITYHLTFRLVWFLVLILD